MASSKRRTKGEGSIVQRPDGRWMGRYTVILSDGTKKSQCIYNKDRKVVVEKMREEMAGADKGTPVLRDKRTTGEYLSYWIQNIAPNQIRPTTLAMYTCSVEKYLMPHLGGIPLTQLKPDHVRLMMNQMQQSGVGVRCVLAARNILSAALREALKLEYVTRNVARLVVPPKYKAPEKRVWTKEQVTHFLGSIKGHQYYALFLILLCYGVRKGEVLGLRWQDVDFDNGVIRIRQTLTVYRKAHFGPPKTKASERDLPLLPMVREALLKEMEDAPKYEDGLIFHSKLGKPVDPISILTTFKRQAKKAGLPELTIHEARHTVATLLVELSPSIKDAQVILGHSSITTTLQYYTHSDFQKKTTALNILAENVL